MAVAPMDGELGRAPKLSRLLTPDETLIYTVRYHYLRGWPMLLLAIACFAASYVWPLAILAFLLCFALWYVPLKGNEVAVTDDRLLLRYGWLKLRLETFEDQNLIRWEMSQNILGTMLDCGTVQVLVREAASTRTIELNWVRHPVTFLEALQAMQDERYRDAT